MAQSEVPTYTIIQADGLYPDNEVEDEIFAPKLGQNYKVDYFQTNLYPTDSQSKKPWSSIPEDVRNQVNGINVLKMPFTEEDVHLFPNLKV